MTTSFQVISPVDGSIILERPYASASMIEQTLQQSRLAQRFWKLRPLHERIQLCEAVVDWMVARAAAIGEELTRQMGRPIRYTPAEITGGFQERARYMMGIAETALAEMNIEDGGEFLRKIKREPLGTVLVLAPWNYPFLTAVNSIIPAILAGNAVILKHAQQTPLAAERLETAFRESGAPEGLFQVLHLTHSQVADVVGDNRIDYVSFTGSVAGGKAIQQAIGHRFIIAGLELGGKDPAYVREDADLGVAAEHLVDGAFFNSGQSCCGVERIYVHHTLFDEFVETFVSLTNQYRLDDPLDPETTLGPMVRSAAAEYARSQICEAVAKGATALIDESRFSRSQSGTAWMAPQVLIGVNHTMEVMKEETFGPVVGIMPVADDAEAIGRMNDSRYGLTASIWSPDDYAAALIADQIEAGTVMLNRCDYLDPALAWTGVKDSGRGCTLSAVGFESLTRPKSLHFRR